MSKFRNSKKNFNLKSQPSPHKIQKYEHNFKKIDKKKCDCLGTSSRRETSKLMDIKEFIIKEKQCSLQISQLMSSGENNDSLGEFRFEM